ncbi:MAG: metal-dependent transcriptional regulator [Clostridiales bacterium]|nr:metal-dependent transcriptional regulator [Clostridiales bacterium]
MAKLSSSLEDYLEAIHILTQDSNKTRPADIADILAVSRPSVSRALGMLKEAGLVDHEAYGLVSLTAQGKAQAKNIMRRHLLIKRFLTDSLGVDEKTAERDACRMEHVMSPRTIEKLFQYIENKTTDANRNE